MDPIVNEPVRRVDPSGATTRHESTLENPVVTTEFVVLDSPHDVSANEDRSDNKLGGGTGCQPPKHPLLSQGVQRPKVASVNVKEVVLRQRTFLVLDGSRHKSLTAKRHVSVPAESLEHRVELSILGVTLAPVVGACKGGDIDVRHASNLDTVVAPASHTLRELVRHGVLGPGSNLPLGGFK